MKNHYKKLIFTGVSVLFLGFFSSVSVANAQSCGEVPQGALIVTHLVCQPSPEKDGRPCEVSGIVDGQQIVGMCTAGCCKVVAYTPSLDIFSSLGGGGFWSQLGTGLLISGAQSLLGQLFGDLGGTTGSTGGIQYRIEDTPGYLSSIDTGSDLYLDDFNLVFEDNTDIVTTPLTYTNTVSGTTLLPIQVDTTPVVVIPTNPTVTVDSTNVTPSYTEVVTTTPEEFFDFSSTDYTAVDNRLSLADLEREAEEARRREALLNEQRGITNLGDIGDYRSSNINRGGTTEEVTEEEEKLSWWQALVLLIGYTFGLTN